MEHVISSKGATNVVRNLGSLSYRELKAVHDDDLELFLERLDLLTSIKEGRVACAACKTIITLENFGGIYPEAGRINVVCDRLECIKPLLEKSK